MIRICFVCLGNICRSPTAHGVMDKMVREAGLGKAIAVESAGTSAYHVGERADARARATAKKRGLELRSRSEQFMTADFDRFDYVLAMDGDNFAVQQSMAPDDAAADKVRMFRSFDPKSSPDADVPDPYYGGDKGFDIVLDICTAGCRGLLEHIRREHELG